MKKVAELLLLVALTAPFANAVRADGPREKSATKDQEVTVFVTGSLIPRRVKLHPIATDTASPVRIIDRREIEQTGRHTATGIIINEPAARIVGH